MKNKQKSGKSNKGVWIILVVVIGALILSQGNIKNEISGRVIDGSGTTGCPADRNYEFTIADSSTGGDWHQFHYSSSAEEAAKECGGYASTAGEQECDTNCGNFNCDGSFTADDNCSPGNTCNGEVTGYISGSNGNYYGFPL